MTATSDPLSGLFSNLLGAPNTWLDGVVRARVGSVAARGPAPMASGVVLVDIGDFLLKVLEQMSRFVESFVSGDHINTYIRSMVNQMENEHGFSELDELEYLDKIHRSLKDISFLIKRQLEETQALWAANRIPSPIHRNVTDFDPYLRPETDTASAEVGEPSMASERRTSRDSVETDAAPDDQVQASIENFYHRLGSRGTGQYHCPYGWNCQKGGIDGGRIRPFVRNSDFKTHLQKHLKLFKCNLPGCTNTEGFARIDQLRRHQIRLHQDMMSHPTG